MYAWLFEETITITSPHVSTARFAADVLAIVDIHLSVVPEAILRACRREEQMVYWRTLVRHLSAYKYGLVPLQRRCSKKVNEKLRIGNG
jgi:hypothetical protein